MYKTEKINITISVSRAMWDEVREYAKTNGLKISDFANDLINKAFAVEKYGDTPFSRMKTEMDKIADGLEPVTNGIQETIKNERIDPIVDSKTNDEDKVATEKVEEETNVSENNMKSVVNKPVRRRLK